MIKDKVHIGYKRTTRKQRVLAKGKPLRMKCPYCGREMQLRSADGIYRENPYHRKLYVCPNYPTCDTYANLIDGTLKPLGTPANGQLRALRKQTHNEFDKIWLKNIMSRKSAYRWMADITGLPWEDAHIGNLRESMCLLVIEKSKELIEKVNKKRNIK
jgi:ssDNA-binding Zn-finger/Zn-ribbon topoisomerase 1